MCCNGCTSYFFETGPRYVAPTHHTPASAPGCWDYRHLPPGTSSLLDIICFMLLPRLKFYWLKSNYMIKFQAFQHGCFCKLTSASFSNFWLAFPKHSWSSNVHRSWTSQALQCLHESVHEIIIFLTSERPSHASEDAWPWQHWSPGSPPGWFSSKIYTDPKKRFPCCPELLHADGTNSGTD